MLRIVSSRLRSSLSTPEARRSAMKKSNKRSASEAAASPRTPSLERQRRKTTPSTPSPSSMPPSSSVPRVAAAVARPPRPPPQPSLSPPWTRESLALAARTLAELEPQRLAPLIEKYGVPYEKLLPKTTATTTTTTTSAKGAKEEEAEESQGQNQNHHHHHFATLARAIVGQQVSGAAAATIYSRVVTACLVEAQGGGRKEKGESDGQKQGFRTSSTALTPEALLAVPPTALRAAGLSERKASYLVGLAERFLDSNSNSSSSNSSNSNASSYSYSLSERLDELAEAGDAGAMVSELISVRGVGTWTAQMHVLFHAGGPDVLPTGDLGIKKGFAKLFGGKSAKGGEQDATKNKKRKSSSSSSSLPSEAQMLSWAEPFRPYRSLLSFYLWRAASE